MRPVPLGCAWRSPTPTESRTPPSCLVGEGRGKGERGKGGAAPLPLPCPIRTRGGVVRVLPWPALLFSLMAHLGPLTPGRIPVTPRCSVKSRFHPEPFRCPNIGFQYINLYVSTISRLLVMSMIISGTPNNLRYIKTYKLIIKLSS